jgi:hypothetical protein
VPRNAAATPPLGGRGSRIDFGADSDSDEGDDADEEDWIGGFKKRRRARWVDPARKLRHTRAFKDIDAVAARTRYQFIHAQQVASLAVGCKALFNATADEVVVEVQYPSLLPRERCVYIYPLDPARVCCPTNLVSPGSSWSRART